jgi:hypothetical protein
MASIFDAYAQAYDKSLRTENAMAENLRRAYLDRQTMDINQANEARRAQQFNIQMPVMQANAANEISQANLYDQLFKTPGFSESFVGQKVAAAQAQNLKNQADLEAWNRLTPAQRADALSTGVFKNLVGTEDERLQYAIQTGDLETVKQRFPGAVKGKYGLELDGIPLTPSSIGMFKMAEAKRLRDESLRGTGTSGTTPMASMADRSAVRRIDNSIAATQPVQPIQPLLPTPAVSAKPAFPAMPTVGSSAPVNQPNLLQSQINTLQNTMPPFDINGSINPEYLNWNSKVAPEINRLQKMLDDENFMNNERALRANTLSQYPWLTKQR